MISEMREASWSAPAPWRFGRSAGKTGELGKVERGLRVLVRAWQR